MKTGLIWSDLIPNSVSMRHFSFLLPPIICNPSKRLLFHLKWIEERLELQAQQLVGYYGTQPPLVPVSQHLVVWHAGWWPPSCSLVRENSGAWFVNSIITINKLWGRFSMVFLLCVWQKGSIVSSHHRGRRPPVCSHMVLPSSLCCRLTLDIRFGENQSQSRAAILSFRSPSDKSWLTIKSIIKTE